MMGWIRRLLDNGEADERQEMMAKVDAAVESAQEELRRSRELRQKKLRMELKLRQHKS